MISDSKGEIKLTLEGVSEGQVRQIDEIIHAMFRVGVFGLKNGKATLLFDSEGVMQEIKLDLTAWKRNKLQKI